MQHGSVIAVALVAMAACQRGQASGSASGEVVPAVNAPSGADLAAAYSGRMRDIRNRVAMIRRYVGSIESRLPTAALSAGLDPLAMTTVTLAPSAFAGVTSEQWARMDAFYSGTELKRLRLLPPPGAKPRTEEFYFDGGKLVYVYIEPDGAIKRDPHVETGGNAFYFGEGGLFAWVRPDGSTADPASVGFRAWNTKLLAEADRFPRAAKRP